MHGVGRERGQAKSDIFGSAREGSRVADPFAAVRDYGLPGCHIEFGEFIFILILILIQAGFMLNPQRAPQNHGVLVKFRSLSRFLPTFGTVHVSYADVRGRGIHAADVFLNDLRLRSGGLDAGGMRNQGGHGGAW